MTCDEAQRYHARQVGVLEETEADLVSGITITSAPEAIGLTRAARGAGLPVVVSFTVETDGRRPRTGITCEGHSRPAGPCYRSGAPAILREARGRMATPKPGRPVRGSETGRPIMAILDLLGRRWMLRIGWELRDGPLAFRELQRRMGMPSPNILTSRLREGVGARLLQKRPDGRYGLTRRGQSLQDLLGPLDTWAKGWARELGRKGRPGG